MDDLLDAAAERANTAQMIFTLIDSEGAGTVPMTSVRAPARPSTPNPAVLSPLDAPQLPPPAAHPLGASP